MLTLGIESTCDETACAIMRGGRTILSNVVASQIDLHKEYGGVVPELACRRHVDLMMAVIDQALCEAKVTLSEIDLIAVAHGPGLIGALLIGLNTAKTLALALDKPLIGVNHVEAHLYAALMSHEREVSFPCLGVVISGGHSAIVLMKGFRHYELVGQTVDDAIGEAFDKVAKLLGLPYPGGPQIERLALTGNPHRYSFKGGQVKGKPLYFSFSGLKTAVLYAIKSHLSDENEGVRALSFQDKCDIAASFQRAALDDIIKKTLAAADDFQTETILFGGGVTNNQMLRKCFVEANTQQRALLWPSIGLSLDNAAMIAGLGFCRYQERGKGDSLDLEPLTRIPFSIDRS